MLRRHWFAAITLALCAFGAAVRAEAVAADEFVRQITAEVLDSLKSDKAIQAGDVSRIRALVDSKVMPNVNFQRMTASAVGPQWRGSSADQKTRMLEVFKSLLVNTYSGALTQVKDQIVSVKPMRGGEDPSGLVVRTQVRGKGDAIQLDYRLEKAGDAWKIYDINVGGFWLVDAYRGQFAKDMANGGIDALINALAEKNKSLASTSKS